MFAVPLRDIVRMHSTSGTAGKPLVVGYTKNDLRNWTNCTARLLTAAEITEHDVVQISFHYDLFTLDIIETYYALDESEKANKIVEEFAVLAESELNYYFSMPPRFAASLDYEQRLAFHYIQRLSDFAKRNGNTDLANRLDESLTNALNQYSQYQ